MKKCWSRCKLPNYDINGCEHRLINYIRHKSKMLSSKKIDLWRDFTADNTDWRYSQSCWYFRTNFVNCCHSNLLSGSTLPYPPFPVWISILYARIQCLWGGGGYGVLGLRQKTPAAKSLYRSFFLDDDILHCLLWALSFCGCGAPHQTLPHNAIKTTWIMKKTASMKKAHHSSQWY